MATLIAKNYSINWLDLTHTLDLAFNDTNYLAVGVIDCPFTSGSSSLPREPLAEVYPFNSTSTEKTIYYVAFVMTGTYYVLKGYVQKLDGKYYAAGSDTIRTYTEVVPDPPAYDHFSAYGRNGMRVYFSKDSTANYTELYWNISGNDPEYYSGYHARTTSATSILVTDLSYESDVYFWLRSRDSVGNVGDWMYCEYITTLSPAAPSPPTITNRFDGGLDMQCGAVSLASTYYFEYRKRGITTWTQIESGTNTCTITGLQYGTAYEFRAKTDLLETYSSINIGTTLPKKPTISVTNITYDTITVQVASLPNNCDRVKVECYEINGTLAKTNWIDPTGRTFPMQSTAFTGLNRNLSYFFIATSYYDAGGDGTGTGTWLESEASERVDATTLNRPNNWEWSYSMVSGGAVYSTVKQADGIMVANIMPYTEWNNFTARINDFRAYKGLTQYSFTSVSSGNSVTAAILNQAINAINPMFEETYKIPNVVAGGSIAASIFNTMRDRLNSL